MPLADPIHHDRLPGPPAPAAGLRPDAAIQDCLAAFERHLRESGSTRLSVLLLGWSSPGLGEAILRLARDSGKEVSIRVVEDDARLADSAAEQLRALDAEALLLRASPGDLRRDPQLLEDRLRQQPCDSLARLREIGELIDTQASEAPLVAAESVDVVLIDMLCNRLPAAQVERMLDEAFRVLRRGGVLLTLQLLADEPLAGPALQVGHWRVLHAPLETEIVARLDAAGFHGMQYLNRAMATALARGDSELALFAVEASKGKQGVCLDQGHAVVLRGPWREVVDDDGHVYRRGERTAVCAKTYALLTRAPYAEYFIGLPNRAEPPLESAPLFDCHTPQLRHPRVSKGLLPLAAAADPVRP